MFVYDSLRTFLAASICLLAISAVVQAQYAGGGGTADDPYRIAAATDLIALGESPDDCDKHFILTADIDLASYIFETALIAPDADDTEGKFQGTPFTGVFDGDGHVIRNLTVDSVGSGRDYLGLFGYVSCRAPFGYVSFRGQVRNLGMENASITGGDDSRYVGGLCGCNNYGSIDNCHSTGTVNGYYGVGGLCGFNYWSISECYSTATIIGEDGSPNIGGLCGYSRYYASISSCYSTGTVHGGRSVGGLCGRNEGDVNCCYSTGTVNGEHTLGGLCGANLGSLSQCHSTGTITGEDNSSFSGGLCGYNSEYGQVTSCFWDRETSERDDSSGGIGLLTSEMMDPMFYSLNGWANDPNWVLDAGRDYPRLAWERTSGQIIPKPTMDWIDGSGTAEDPYRISSAYQLSLVGKTRLFHDKHLSLSADIDCEGLNATPVGCYWDEGFVGVFDGNNHEIRNLTIDLPNGRDVGFLARIREGAVIKNLRVENGHVTGSERVGGVIGSSSGGIITDCGFHGMVVGNYGVVGGIAGSFAAAGLGSMSDCHAAGIISGGRTVGGLIGSNTGGAVIECWFEGSVIGDNRVGGIVGYNGYEQMEPNVYIEGQLLHCRAGHGDVTGDRYVGGIAGYNGDGIIAGCYAENSSEGSVFVGGLAGCNELGTIGNSCADGDVRGEDGIGGLVGVNGGDYEWSRGRIVNCYSTGRVSGEKNVGGLVGVNQRGVVRASFWDIEIGGLANMCGVQDDIATGCDSSFGKTTAEMQDPSTFIEAGWDFERPIWTIEGADYPRLVWDWPTHVFRIEILTGYDYEDPDDPSDTEYEFHLEVMTDDTVEKIEFVTPAGELFEIPKIPQEEAIEGGFLEQGREYEAEHCAYAWRYDMEFDNPNSLVAYGDGRYTIIVNYDDGRQEETTAWFGIPNSDDPITPVVQKPAFTSFAHQNRLTSPVTIEWESPVNPDVNLVRFDLENQDTDEDLEYELGGGISGLDNPLSLSEGTWETSLAFAVAYETENTDGIEVWCVKYSVSDYLFTVEP